jgi:holo-[acyl-carrier protein] synthase
MAWTDLEVRNDLSGQPRVHICGAARDHALGMRISDILISISHCRAYATAHAVAIRDNSANGNGKTGEATGG